MLEAFRTHPQQTLAGIIQRRKQQAPEWQPPASIRLLERMFLQDSRTRDRFGALALRIFRVRKSEN
jgi:hypothetical protein